MKLIFVFVIMHCKYQYGNKYFCSNFSSEKNQSLYDNQFLWLTKQTLGQ